MEDQWYEVVLVFFRDSLLRVWHFNVQYIVLIVIFFQIFEIGFRFCILYT